MEEGIKTRLKKVEEKFEEIEKKKNKKPKIIRKLKLPQSKKKKNFVTIIKINENRELDIQKEQIETQTIMVDGVPRLASGEYILNYKKEPVMILPSWSVKPFSPSQNYQESLTDGSNTVGYRLLLERMKLGAAIAKKKIGWGITIGILIILIVLAYGLFAG